MEAVIEQSNYPAIAGNVPLSDSIKAERIALLMINKIANGRFPPTLTVNEVNEIIDDK